MLRHLSEISRGYGIITNTGTLTLTNPVTRTISTWLDNTGTVIHTGSSNLNGTGCHVAALARVLDVSGTFVHCLSTTNLYDGTTGVRMVANMKGRAFVIRVWQDENGRIWGQVSDPMDG